MVILFVCLEVIIQVANALAQKGDLHFRRAGVALASLEFLD